jgi:nucleoside-diphosphate-sugar epimerase
MRTVLITGATGFLGGAVLAAVHADPTLQPVAACRRPERMPPHFAGEVRVGDLTDPSYRVKAVEGVDVIVHAGTWAAFWGHPDEERRYFREPTLGLIDAAVAAGVQRFVLTSTVAAGAAGEVRTVADRDRPAPRADFWPHLAELIRVDAVMRARAGRTGMVTLRLGHFVGAGNRIGLVPALVPRLRTHVVPWLAGGRARMPLVTAEDLGQAVVRTVRAELPEPYDNFAICGPEFPTARQVITAIAATARVPRPRYSVPYSAAFALATALERLQPITPGAAPFLTRSLVHLARDWWCPDRRAEALLGYRPVGDWRIAVREAASDLPPGWPKLLQDS